MPNKRQSEERDRLLDRLREANAAYETQDQAGRLAVLASLNSVVEYLMTFEEVEAEQLANPLVALAAAIVDLDEGVPTPLLALKRSVGRRPTSTARKFVCGCAVETIDLLRETGLSEKEAAKRIAAKLNKCKVAHLGWGRGKISPITVIKWQQKFDPVGLREKIRQKTGQDITSLASESRAEVRRRVLASLESVLLAFRAGDEKLTLIPNKVDDISS